MPKYRILSSDQHCMRSPAFPWTQPNMNVGNIHALRRAVRSFICTHVQRSQLQRPPRLGHLADDQGLNIQRSLGRYDCHRETRSLSCLVRVIRSNNKVRNFGIGEMQSRTDYPNVLPLCFRMGDRSSH